jgi:hypothetical protein
MGLYAATGGEGAPEDQVIFTFVLDSKEAGEREGG